MKRTIRLPKKTAGVFFFGLAFLALFLLKFNTINAPFHWDVMGYIVPHTENIIDHGILIDPQTSLGHPPLFLLMLASVWTIFGKGLVVSHLLTLVLGALALTFIFILAEKLYGFETAVLAVLFLLFSQTFFTQVGLVYLEVPIMAASILAVYAYLKDKRGLYILAASLMLLVKEAAVVVVGAILLSEWVSGIINRDKLLTMIKKTVYLSLPLLPLSIWWGIHFLVAGRIFPPGRVFINSGNYFEIFFRLLGKTLIYDSSIECYNRANWIIFFFVIVYVAVAVKRKNAKHEVLYLTIIVLNIAFFSITNDLPRYFLIILPYFFLLGARAIIDLSQKWRVRTLFRAAIVAAFIIVSVVSTYGKRQTDGWRLESNMEYLDMVRLHQKVALFLQKEYPESSIVANFPLNLALRNPVNGYVDKGFDMVDIRRIPENRPVIFVWSAQSDFGALASYVKANRQNLNFVRDFSFRGKRVEIMEYSPSFD